MNNIRPSAVAGKFYTEDKIELSNQINGFKKNDLHDYDYSTRAVIVPHAGYIYSGKLASAGIQYLDKNVKNVFIIAPPHRVAVKDVALSSFSGWETPLGCVEVNQEINQELVNDFGCNFSDEAFREEHSVEVQVPFIQNFLPNAKIVPILASNTDKIVEILNKYFDDKENAFVISSDLSHFHPAEKAKKIDSLTAEMIEAKNIDNFSPEQACGAVGICALVRFAKEKEFSLIRIGMFNSGEITGETSSVVGYGGWLLYEGSKNEFIKKYFSKYVIDVCKESISSLINERDLKLEHIPAVFAQSGASFVTLEKNGELRGCIGSIIAHRILISDLAQNARNAAFNDPRFQPVKKDELDKLTVNVSLLSEPEKLFFKSEEDLLSQIRQNIDGLIIKDGDYQAVYLPSVWEQLPDKNVFLDSLKIKAGMTPKHFSETFEAFRFTTEYIKLD